MLTPEMIEAVQAAIDQINVSHILEQHRKKREQHLLNVMRSGGYNLVAQAWVHRHLSYYFHITSLEELRHRTQNLKRGDLLLVKKGIHPDAAFNHDEMCDEMNRLRCRLGTLEEHYVLDLGEFDEHGIECGCLLMDVLLPRSADAPKSELHKLVEHLQEISDPDEEIPTENYFEVPSVEEYLKQRRDETESLDPDNKPFDRCLN